MKALPWLKILAAFLLVYVALSMFRFKVVEKETRFHGRGLRDGEQRTGTLDRWTGRVKWWGQRRYAWICGGTVQDEDSGWQ